MVSHRTKHVDALFKNQVGSQSMPFNSAAKHLMLDALDESLATGIDFVGAHTVTDPGTGTNANSGEATGGGYARQAVTWGAAASEQKTNTATVSIPVDTGTYGFVTFWNANIGNTNNYLGYAPMGGAATIKGFFTVDTTLTNDQLLSPGHGLSNNDRLMLFNVFGEALPTGLTEGTDIYHVVSTATNTFKVSLTQGGAAVDITAVGGGEGFFQRVVPETFNAPGNITVAVGALVLDGTVV